MAPKTGQRKAAQTANAKLEEIAADDLTNPDVPVTDKDTDEQGNEVETIAATKEDDQLTKAQQDALERTDKDYNPDNPAEEVEDPEGVPADEEEEAAAGAAEDEEEELGDEDLDDEDEEGVDAEGDEDYEEEKEPVATKPKAKSGKEAQAEGGRKGGKKTAEKGKSGPKAGSASAKASGQKAAATKKRKAAPASKSAKTAKTAEA